MGSKSNTWCKKLMHKAKVHAMKGKLGNEEGVFSRGGTTPHHQAASMLNARRADPAGGRAIEGDTPLGDKPLATPPKFKERNAPMKAGRVLKPFKPRGGCYSGSVMSPEVRARIKAHDTRLNDQVRALIVKVA
jgi:hypothetical protein